MARQRKEKAESHKDIKLGQPDRSGPKEKTLLDIAQERNLFDEADERMRKNKAAAARNGEEDTLSPRAERILESMLWTATLAMLHFTFDILVQKQYGERVEWPVIMKKTAQAYAGPSRNFHSPKPP